MTRITDVQRKMLQRLGLARNAHFFTNSVNGYQPLSEPVAQKNLDELEQAGLIFQFRTGYKVTQRGRDYMDSSVVVNPQKSQTRLHARPTPHQHGRQHAMTLTTTSGF